MLNTAGSGLNADPLPRQPFAGPGILLGRSDIAERLGIRVKSLGQVVEDPIEPRDQRTSTGQHRNKGKDFSPGHNYKSARSRRESALGRATLGSTPNRTARRRCSVGRYLAGHQFARGSRPAFNSSCACSLASRASCLVAKDPRKYRRIACWIAALQTGRRSDLVSAHMPAPANKNGVLFRTFSSGVTSRRFSIRLSAGSRLMWSI